MHSILLLTQYYSPEPIGTAPYATDLAEWLAATGATVKVFTNRPAYPHRQVLAAYATGERDCERMAGVSIRRVDPYVPQKGSVGERLRADARFLAQGLKVLLRWDRAEQHVVSFCPSIFTVLLGGFVARKGSRHIAVVHDIQSGLAQGLKFQGARHFAKVLRRLEATALNRADAVVALSPEMTKQLRNLGVIVPIFELPIWVDTTQIFPVQARSAHPPTLLYSGNLGKKQGLNVIVALAERLAAIRPDVRVLVRGAGNQSDMVMAEVRERKLSNVEFQSLVPKHELNNALADGDVHLVPQDPDAADFALPSKLYTILAAGRVAIATGRPGSALWRLAHDSGAFVCVAPDDVDMLAARAVELLDDECLRARLGAVGRSFIQDFAAKEKVLAAYCKLISGQG